MGRGPLGGRSDSNLFSGSLCYVASRRVDTVLNKVRFKAVDVVT